MKLSLFNFRSLTIVLLSLFITENFSAQKYQRFIVDSLSSPYMHGRGYINDGSEKAAVFISYQFDSLGLNPYNETYFQKFSFKVNTFPGEMSLNINGKSLEPGVDFLVDPQSGGGNVSNYEVKEINLFKRRQLEKLVENINSLNETVLLINLPDTLSSNGRMLFMQTVYLLCEQWPVLLQSEEKLTWGVANRNFRNPLLIINGKSIRKKDKVSFNIDQKLVNSEEKNVIGIREGANNKERYLIVSAHYDHLGRMGSETYFPGANDNASGVAEMLALISSLQNIELDHTLLFIAFAGEEAGLIGSSYFVNNPIIALNTIDFLLNLDLNGTGEEGITVVNATKFQTEYEILININDSLNLVPEIKKRGPAANSDHYPFYSKGVPSFFIYTRGGIKAYHDVFDRPETLPLNKAEELVELYRNFIIQLDKLD